MPYSMSTIEQQHYQELISLINGKSPAEVGSTYWSSDVNYFNQYHYVYEYLGSVQLASDGSLKAGAEQATVAWFEGAATVNKGIGAYSDFIRAYTQNQVTLRTGGTNVDLQGASDDIARNVISTIGTGATLPSLQEIGNIDAGSVVGRLFGDPTDYAAWSGSPLFIALGNGSFFENHIIEDTGNVSSYDLLAMIDSIKAGGLAVGAQIGSVGDLASTIAQVWAAGTSHLPFSATAVQIATELEKSNRFYNDQFDDDVGGVLSAISSNIVLGKMNENSEIDGSSDDDAIAGGTKDDKIFGSEGRDLVDGGLGNDTLDYSDMDTKFKIRFGSNAYGTTSVEIEKGTSGKDSVTRVENFILGTSGDIVKLDDESLEADSTSIDAGTQQAGQYDVIDFSGLSSGVTLTRSVNSDGSLLEVDGSSIVLQNFEGIIGSNNDDNLVSSDANGFIFGNGGNDTITGTDYDDLLEGGAGADILFTGDGFDRIIIDQKSYHSETFYDESSGETFQYDADDVDIVKDGSSKDRLFIRGASFDGNDTLIPIIGGDAMYAGWADEEYKHSTFEGNSDFHADFHNSWRDENGNRVSLGGSLPMDFDVNYSRMGNDLQVDVTYGDNNYGILLENFHTGDYGINFVNGINYLFTDGVKSWETEGLATMRSVVANSLAPERFSSAPSLDSFT